MNGLNRLGILGRGYRIKAAGLLLALGAALPVSADFTLRSAVNSNQVKQLIGDRHGFFVFKDKDKSNLILRLRLPDLVVDTVALESGSVFHIKISPDGQYVMYAVGSDKMVVRGLGSRKQERYEIGSGHWHKWWKHPGTGETYIIWSTENGTGIKLSIDGGTGGAKYAGETLRARFTGNGLDPQRETLLNQGFKAGLSRDGRWMGTADKTLFLYDFQEKSIHHLKMQAYSGASTCWSNISPTIEPSRMDQMTFINTHHDTLITKNSRDEEVWKFRAPVRTVPGIDSTRWHALGWSNEEDFMSATLQHVTAPKTYIGYLALVRRSDKQVLPLGEYGMHQDLWFAEAPEYTTVSLFRRPGPLKGISGRAEEGLPRVFRADGRSLRLQSPGSESETLRRLPASPVF